jgi:plasmid maintenance system antidote protein VapI
MEEKLKRLMKQEGINSTRLAEILGIQASGISHIMSGRNKPSFDFLLKLLQRFPQINPDWLLLDKGPMYRDEIKNKGGQNQSASQGSPAMQSPATQFPHGAQSPGAQFPQTAHGTPSSGAFGAMSSGSVAGAMPPGESAGLFHGQRGFDRQHASQEQYGSRGHGAAGHPGGAHSGAGYSGDGRGGTVYSGGDTAGRGLFAPGPGVHDMAAPYNNGAAAAGAGGFQSGQAHTNGPERDMISPETLAAAVSGAHFGPDNDDIIPSSGSRRRVDYPADSQSARGHAVNSGGSQNSRSDQVQPNYPPPASVFAASHYAQAGHAGNFTRSATIERIVVFYKDKTFSEYQPE